LRQDLRYMFERVEAVILLETADMNKKYIEMSELVLMGIETKLLM